jgi:N-hydroxyarylamine O-acetyltransferase
VVKIPAWLEDYLDILELDRLPPSESFLANICTRHLNVFPFENISKLIFYRDRDKMGGIIPDTGAFVSNHRTLQYGGTCFAQNINLFHVLTELGFDCRLIVLSRQHVAVLVSLPEVNHSLYVDVGAAAPFFRPVPLVGEPPVTRFGIDEIHIVPARGDGQYTFTRYLDGKVSGEPWSFDIGQTAQFPVLQEMIAHAHEPGTTFMQMLRCQLWQSQRQRSVSLVNNVFTVKHKEGAVERHTLTSVGAIESVLEQEFGLERLPVGEAVGILASLGVDVFQAK